MKQYSMGAAINEARYILGIKHQPPSKTNSEISNMLHNQSCHICALTIEHMEKIYFDKGKGMRHLKCKEESK